MTDLDRITAELAEIQDALLGLDAGRFAERYELELRRDRLRAEADRYRRAADERRPTPALVAELRSIAARVAAAERRVSGFTMMSGPGGTGGAPAAVSGEMTRAVIDAKANAASDLGPLLARKAIIERVLVERGIDPASGRARSAAGPANLGRRPEPTTE